MRILILLFLCGCSTSVFSQDQQKLISSLNTYGYRVIVNGDGALLSRASVLPPKDAYGLDNTDRSLEPLKKEFHLKNTVQLSCRYILSDGGYTAKLYPWLIDPSSITYQKVTLSGQNNIYYYQVNFEGHDALAIGSAKHSVGKIILKTQSAATAESFAGLLKSTAINSKRTFDDLDDQKMAGIDRKIEEIKLQNAIKERKMQEAAREFPFFNNEWIAVARQVLYQSDTGMVTEKWEKLDQTSLQVFSTLEKMTFINKGQKTAYSLKFEKVDQKDSIIVLKGETPALKCTITWLNSSKVMGAYLPGRKELFKEHALLVLQYDKLQTYLVMTLKDPPKPASKKEILSGTIH